MTTYQEKRRNRILLQREKSRDEAQADTEKASEDENSTDSAQGMFGKLIKKIKG